MEFSDFYFNSNFCFFITSHVLWSLILPWSFFKGELTTWRWLQIELCNLSFVYFVVLLPFIVLLGSIHDIPPTIVFIIYRLYLAFIILILMDCFKTPNILEDDLTVLNLTKTNERDLYAFLWLFQVCQSLTLTLYDENVYVSSYITFYVILILTWTWKHLTHLFHWRRIQKTITLPFPINDIHVLFSRSSDILLINNYTRQ